jgi:hypothetical protein
MDGTLGFKWKGRGAELGVYLTQEVCVVGHHFQFDDRLAVRLPSGG